jgi:hypothetical protein
MTITAHCYPGLSLQVRIMQGATPVGSVLNMAESVQAGYYTVATPGGLADGAYQLLLICGGQVIGQSAGIVRSAVFVDSAVLPDIAPAVRTNLATELARMDVAVSTRPTVAQIEASTVLAKEATVTARPTLAQMIASTLAKTGDAMTLTSGERTSIAAAVWGATTRTLSSFGTLIADFWTNATRTLTADPGAAAHSATQALVAAAAATNQTEHEATQSAVAGVAGSIAAIGDPLANPVPGTYPPGSAGEALSKLVVGPPGEPAVVIPGAPADVGLCRVYAYLEGINNDKRLPTARIEFRLIAPDGTKAVASERLIAERLTTLKVDDLGRLQGEDGQPWADLQRNDLLTPAGTTYEVTSAALGISRKVITLTTEVADLRALLLA